MQADLGITAPQFAKRPPKRWRGGPGHVEAIAKLLAFRIERGGPCVPQRRVGDCRKRCQRTYCLQLHHKRHHRTAGRSAPHRATARFRGKAGDVWAERYDLPDQGPDCHSIERFAPKNRSRIIPHATMQGCKLAPKLRMPVGSQQQIVHEHDGAAPRRQWQRRAPWRRQRHSGDCRFAGWQRTRPCSRTEPPHKRDSRRTGNTHRCRAPSTRQTPG